MESYLKVSSIYESSSEGLMIGVLYQNLELTD